MKRTLWDLLRGKTLLQEAFEEGLDMLLQVKYMYIETNKLLFEEVKEGFDPYSIDKQVNKERDRNQGKNFKTSRLWSRQSRYSPGPFLEQHCDRH
jgi:hypothetical protein